MVGVSVEGFWMGKSVIDGESFIDAASIARARSLGDAHARGEDVTASVTEEIAKYQFYHSLEILPGLTTSGLSWAPSFQEAFAKVAQNFDFSGKRVLDIGCRDGSQLLTAEQLGAAELIGVDSDPSPGLTNFVVPFKNSKIQVYGANIYELTPEDLGTFDVVICCGLLYHLRYPMLGIKRMADLIKEGGLLLLETALIDGFGDLPILFSPIGAQSPFEGSSPTFFNLAGLANAFGQAALTTPDVLIQFNVGEYDTSKYFKAFSAVADQTVFKIPRTIVSASKRSVQDDGLEKYFEGRHKYHSTGQF